MDSETQIVQSQQVAVLAGLDTFTVPKHAESCQTEYPPAYTASARPSIIENLAAYIAHHADAQAQRISPCPQASISALADEESLEELSPISLRISTRINVARDGNLIALPCSPADQANSIAKAVVEAIQGRDWATGLPMIDENGRPRPVKLEVDAGITVEGSSNVIGTESVIKEFLRQNTQAQKRSFVRQCRTSTSSPVTSPLSNRRRRASDLDLPERSTYKRARSEE